MGSRPQRAGMLQYDLLYRDETNKVLDEEDQSITP